MSESSSSDSDSKRINLQAPIDSNSSSSDDNTEHENRCGNSNWYQCGKYHYILLVNEQERMCNKVINYMSVLHPFNCSTGHLTNLQGIVHDTE